MFDYRLRQSKWNWRLLESDDLDESKFPTENKMQLCCFEMENLA
jgi:hypothetical protein